MLSFRTKIASETSKAHLQAYEQDEQKMSARPVSSVSEASTTRADGTQAVTMQRIDSPTAINVSSPISSPTMPPWLREAVAQRKRQLAESRALDSPEHDPRNVDGFFNHTSASRLTHEHFGFPLSDHSPQYRSVSKWLSGLPDKLTESWETVLREEVQEVVASTRAKRRTRGSGDMTSQGGTVTEGGKRHTFFEDVDSEDFDFCPGVAPIDDDYNFSDDDEDDDEFLLKVLLGRKRLMQAEISVKRLKMGLKHVTSGLCGEFNNATNDQRTQELLAEVDTTFEDVIRKRLSNATAIRQRADNNDEQKQKYRRKLRGMRDKDSGFILQIYTEREIQELKTMVADIIGMDEASGDDEGTDWFWNMLPRLLELRGDMAEAEREFARLRDLKAGKKGILNQRA